MPEMAGAGEGHRHPPFVCGGNDFRIFDGTPGLDGRGRARFRRRNQAIRKRKKGVTANGASLE